MNLRIGIIFLLILALFIGCGKKEEKQLIEEPIQIGGNALDMQSDFKQGKYSSFDTEVSFDNLGSLKIVAPESTTVRIMDLGPQDISGVELLYQAKVKTEDVIGQVFLEMLCSFSEKGEYFSRGLDQIVTSSSDWTTLEIPFFIKDSDKPSNVKLNIVINGTGIVWVDDIKMFVKPYKY